MRHQNWPAETEPQNNLISARSSTRRLTPIRGMGPIRGHFGGPTLSNAGDQTGWLRMQSAANQSPHQIPC
jgi:hypothetical protein